MKQGICSVWLWYAIDSGILLIINVIIDTDHRRYIKPKVVDLL